MREKIIIIGAGLTGLSTAYHIEKKIPGKDDKNRCILIEKESSTGGLCRSINSEGFVFDIGGHFLHTKEDYVRKFFVKHVKDIKLVRRNSKIFINNRLIPYPFQGNLYYLPDGIREKCLLEYIKSYAENKSVKSETDESFEEWIKKTFGRGIAGFFMEPFNRKLYKVPLGQISAKEMRRYVPVPDLNEIVYGALYGSKKRFGYNAEFYYPAMNGIQSFADAVRRKVNSKILTNTEVIYLDAKKRKLRLSTGSELEYEQLVSTMPLKNLVKIMTGAPSSVKRAANLLRHNSLVIVNIGLRGKPKENVHWIYLPGKEFECYRIGFYSEVAGSMAPHGMSSAYVEFSVNCKKDKVNFREIEKKAVNGLKKINMIKSYKDILCIKSIFIEYGYVICDFNRGESVKVINNYLNKNQIYSSGRYGAWEYSTMSDAIMSGKRIAEHMISL